MRPHVDMVKATLAIVLSLLALAVAADAGDSTPV
jgi:hypothetical protein